MKKLLILIALLTYSQAFVFEGTTTGNVMKTIAGTECTDGTFTPTLAGLRDANNGWVESPENTFKKDKWTISYEAILTALDKIQGNIRLMPLGDSITYGSWSGHATGSDVVGYRGRLWTELQKTGRAIDFVGSKSSGTDYRDNVDDTFDMDNEGHHGWRVDEINGDIDGWLTTYTPNLILVHLGTNDLNQDQTVESTVSDMSALLDKIRAYSTDAQIVVAQIIQRNPTHAATSTYNTQLKTMLENRADDNLYIVNMEEALDYSTDMIDEHHPNAQGSVKMADVWLNSLGVDTTEPPIVATFNSNYIARLKLDTGATDDKGVYNGTYNDTDVTFTGTSAHLTGGSNKFITLPRLALNTTLTMSTWIKRDEIADSWVAASRSSISDRSQGEWNWGLHDSLETLVFNIQDGTSNNWQNVEFKGYEYGDTELVGEWKHIAITFDGTNMRAYLDGVLVDTVAFTGTPHLTGSSSTTIGGLAGSAFTWKGDIAEFIAYDFVLSDTEIAEIYNAQKGQFK